MTVIDEAFETLWGIVLCDIEVLLKTALSAFDSIAKYRLGICTHLKKRLDVGDDTFFFFFF